MACHSLCKCIKLVPRIPHAPGNIKFSLRGTCPCYSQGLCKISSDSNEQLQSSKNNLCRYYMKRLLDTDNSRNARK